MPAASNPDPTSDSNPRPAKSTSPLGSPLGSLVQAESAIQLALAIPGGCFVGLFIGYLLDKHFHTHWIVLLGMALGAAGGFIQVFQSASRLSKGRDE